MRKLSFTAVTLLLSGAAAVAQQLPALNPVASRVLGRPASEKNELFSFNPNLADARALAAPRGVAVDTSASPPILYVSDTGNNRVLAWRDASSFSNGQAADLVIGQIDFFHTGAQGPGTAFSTGLTNPTGLAVDADGNLYVVDTGNNRVLRFKRPFDNQGNPFPDLYLGQPNLSSKAAGSGKSGLNLASTFSVNITFDSAGNLWVVDPANRRVLRFPKTELAKGGGSLEADLVVGQPDFTNMRVAVTNATRTAANAFAIPIAVAFDSAGRLWVSDSDSTGNVSRVLIFEPFTTNDPSASRILGVIPGQPTSQDQLDRTDLAGPTSIFFVGSRPAVVDSLHNRILIFDPIATWPEAAALFSPLAAFQVGQPDFHSAGANQTTTGSFVGQPGPGTLYQPLGAAYANGALYVADTFNHRLIVLPPSGESFTAATRVLGQDDFQSSSINLLEGREFAFVGARTNRTTGLDSGVAVDSTTDVPHLYVADTYNHRILGFRDFRSVKPGMTADLVIGQPDFRGGLCNQTGNPDKPSQTSLCEPIGLAVDASGNLYVADHGNARVLRFPAPFNQQGEQRADLVLGQPNFLIKVTDPTDRTMAAPYGIAVAQSNGIVVSDEVHNRVLYFAFQNGGFTSSDNGRPATKVFGQPNFTSTGSGSAPNRMNAPKHIAVDTEARLYVADSGNNRVAIFDQIAGSGTPDRDANAALSLAGVTQPRAVYVSEVSGEVWVADNATGQVRRYPRFDTLISNQNFTASVQAAGSPTAITQDRFGALTVADVSSRVSVFYPGLRGMNNGNRILSRPLAPNTQAQICVVDSACDGSGTPTFGTITSPLVYPPPKELADIQVLVNDTPAPIYFVSPHRINIVVPWSAPTSGSAEVLVVQKSTGRIYAAGSVQMNPVSPGVFILDDAGPQRRAAVINQDGTVNGPSNPAPRGSVVEIYATGQGLVPGAPPDGEPPTTLVRTPFTPRVLLNGIALDEYNRGNLDPPANEWVAFSGLSPQFPGFWQINIHIPTNIVPNAPATLHVFANSVPSNDITSGYQVVIYIGR